MPRLRNRSDGALFLSSPHTTTPGWRAQGVCSYSIHLTEAERIALRLVEGGLMTRQVELHAERKARMNAKLRPRRFSWEVEQ